MPDSDEDYEIMPRQEVERLRRDLASVKQRTSNPVSDITSISDLYAAINRLNSSIIKLVTILEDAQQDIIAEYQQSKPAEKLNQILDQNETIAKAILSLNDSIVAPPKHQEQQPQQTTNEMSLDQGMMPSPQFQPSMQPNMPPRQNMAPPMAFQNIPPLDANIPPPDMLPEHKKKKFLGFI